MKRNGTRLGHPIGNSEDIHLVGVNYGMVARDTSAPCASGDKCINTPPTRVDIRGEQCASCLRCQRDMRARLRAR